MSRFRQVEEPRARRNEEGPVDSWVSRSDAQRHGGAKRMSANRHSCSWLRTQYVIQNRACVVYLAAPLVIDPFAGPDTAEVETRPRKLAARHLREVFGNGERDRAVHAAAVQWVRMTKYNGPLGSWRRVRAYLERSASPEPFDACRVFAGDRDRRRTDGRRGRRRHPVDVRQARGA